ncbi:MAG: molybdopterin-binding protein [Nitrospiraceae bacterium]|nr:molybdopterin-binding protein [Nitrospiraceae bacterium]MDA8090899.1 molybdopterin-binding protein [Nitrospiraceae bacterium]
MCDDFPSEKGGRRGKTVPAPLAVGMVLAHDITEVRPDFKGRAFRKGHIVKEEDVPRLILLGKENLFVLDLAPEEMHEDEAALVMSEAIMGGGVETGECREGKINLIASIAGLLQVDKEALMEFNMQGEVMCATLHDRTVVQKGQKIAATRAIPLVVSRRVVEQVVSIAREKGGMVKVIPIRKPKTGVVITGGEVFSGMITDSFAPVIRKKINALGGEILGIAYAPDDKNFIAARLREFIEKGADLLIATGGMSVDPDDVTRFAIRDLGARNIAYGAAVVPGSMFLSATVENGEGRVIPVLGVPTCAMYGKTTVLDLVLPRVLAGEEIGRKELAELGHGGLCLHCEVCLWPVCPFGKF